jgi:hypothetical protein
MSRDYSNDTELLENFVLIVVVMKGIAQRARGSLELTHPEIAFSSVLNSELPPSPLGIRSWHGEALTQARVPPVI